jgi:hypothetical protein
MVLPSPGMIGILRNGHFSTKVGLAPECLSKSMRDASKNVRIHAPYGEEEGLFHGATEKFEIYSIHTNIPHVLSSAESYKKSLCKP